MSELHSEGQMTHAEAQAALEGAGAQEAAASAEASPAQAAADLAAERGEQAPEPTPGEVTPPVVEEQTDEFTAPDVAPDSFTGADFNPDLLPEELQPGWKQLQGSYTQKTQELAEQRKALEALGAPDELQQAAEFYQSLKDPEYLRDFYAELGNVVQELGLVEAPVDPTVVAPEPVAPELPAELAALVQSEPELAPMAQQFAEMRSRLDTFEQQQAAREQAMAEERQLMEQAGQIDQMVQAVRESHPDYGDSDWDAIYDRAVAFDGDVTRAAELYEADRDRIIQSYLSSKQTPHAVTPTPGGGTVTEDEPVELQTMDDAQRAAEAFISANDLSEFGG